MKIITPTTKIRISAGKCGQRALAAFLGRRHTSFLPAEKYEISVENQLFYIPYWIVSINTVKSRAFPLYPDKKITFYMVCNGLNEEYIVLRNIPKTTQIEVQEEQILALLVSESRLKDHLINDAIRSRINHQYIFGPPRIVSQSRYLMYLPVRKVHVGQKTAGTCGNYYVNVYTGEVKRYNMEED